MNIDDSAIVYPNVELGQNAIIEPFAIVGIQDRFHEPDSVMLGDNAFIGSRCTVYAGVKAGDNFDISDQSSIFVDNIFGHNVRIGPKAIIKNSCRVGNNVRINAKVFMERVVVGSNVFIGPGTTFTDDRHPACPRYADCVPKIEIGDFVSIGANVVVAPGVKIAHHCQIYAGAVVTKNIEPYSVVAGNPAKKIKDFRELTCDANFYEKPFIWWEEHEQKTPG